MSHMWLSHGAFYHADDLDMTYLNEACACEYECIEFKSHSFVSWYEWVRHNEFIRGVWIHDNHELHMNLSIHDMICHGTNEGGIVMSTNMDESWYMWMRNVTCEWVMSRMDEAWYMCVYEWVMARMIEAIVMMRHVDESRHIWMNHITYGWGMAHMRKQMSHGMHDWGIVMIRHMDESWLDTYR